ncbi:MAG: PIG-L family deacetylase [Candidatus Marinimicrobia bacterium]|nr:PIG-L family deacetylase [Candidatus Neomarinimicrobiota bacterium]
MEASKILGLKRRINLGLENRYLIDSKETRIKVAEQIRIFKPDILFCPYYQDAHPDHIATHSIVKSARFYSKYTRTDMSGEPHYASNLIFYFCTHLRINHPFSFLIDISKYFSKKIKSVACYRSQFIENIKNRGIFRSISSQNSYWGSLIRAKFAEAFYSEEALKIEDIDTIL